MTTRLLRLSLVFLVFSWSIVSAADFTFPEKMQAHPRIFLTKQKETEIKEQIKTDPFLDKLVKELINKADKATSEPFSKYEIPDGKRLLAQSRRSLERTTALAFAYRMTGEQKYADTAIEEMLTVCRFKDWNPSHYLDTAEMATAVGLGYDWLYEVIPAEKREEIKNGLMKHAINTSLEVYKTGGWWTTVTNNWNEVCNAGLTIAAIALADDERQTAETVIDYAIKSFPRGLSVYKPDGAYPEGPGYWAYGSFFAGLMIMTLENVFQDDFGFLTTEGLNKTGDYYMGIIGPRYRTFNYADGGDSASASPMMFALSHMYNRPDYAVWLRTFLEKKNRYASGREAVFHVLWYNPKGTENDFAKTPLAQKFTGIQDICTMRTAWNDPNAAFVGFKAGNNRASHGHLDIGSFIYEVNGVRWAIDLGTDNYNLPGYFGDKRWDYYRLNTQSHNTLVVDGKNQNPMANCKIVNTFFDTPTEMIVGGAVAVMTDAYKGQVQEAARTVVLGKDSGLLINDQLKEVTSTVRWGMITQADIKIEEYKGGKIATLSQDGKKVRVFCTHGKFEIISTKPPTEAENQNKGYSMLAVMLEPEEGVVKLSVSITPIP